MQCLFRPLILVFLLITSGKLCSQDAFSDLDKVYGPDPSIYNGKKYSYFLPSGTEGNQFFASTEFVKSGILVKARQGDKETGGLLHDNLYLNYDIYNQKLLLQYSDETGAAQIIEVSEAWLEGFNLGTRKFIYFDNNDASRIYQALGDGKYLVLYHWRKSLNLSNSMGSGTYAFSEVAKSRFVLIEGELRPFGSKGSFIKLFNPAHKVEIKNYLQSNGISLKKGSEESMNDLINYISNLD